MTIKVYYPKSGTLDIPELINLVCNNPSENPLELTGIVPIIDKLKRSQLGDALTAIRAVVAALNPLDELFKMQLLKKTDKSFETEFSRIDISRSEQQRLDTTQIREDMSPVWLKKYTKTIQTTTVTALTHERWEAMQKKKSRLMKKTNRKRRAA